MMHRLRRWLAACLLLALASVAGAQDLLPVPALSARVIDQTGTLRPEQRAALEAKLAAFEQSAGPQIVVLLVPSTQPEDIAAYAQRVADSWKIGRRDVGDGLLIVVAKDDRRVRIEVAKALEGAVPDLAARLIIDRAIAPGFKVGDFAGGLDAGIDQLMQRIRGENLPAPQARGQPGQTDAFDVPWQELAMFFFVGVLVIGGILKTVLGRKLGSLVTAGGAGAAAWAVSASLLLGVLAAVVALFVVALIGTGALHRGAGRGGRGGFGGPIIWGGGGGGFGGGGGGFGGGGFGSGGGGDFGGGGASGDW